MAVRDSPDDFPRDGFWVALDADERLGALGWSVDESVSRGGELAWRHPERAGAVRWRVREAETFVREREGEEARGTLSEILVVLVHERD